ncbi:MAG: hypothetical protein LBN24_01485 [Mediterranea sp.]|nr:hypothetical protein [Mediterranea sp.]
MKGKVMFVLMAALMMGSQMSLSAQEQKKENAPKHQRPTQEQIAQMQTNQMVRTLMLDDATTAKFTPLYQAYLKELRDARMAGRKQWMEQRKAGKDQGTDATARKQQPKAGMTDAQIAAMIKNRFAQSRKLLDIREKYYADFSKMLSQKQILKMYELEKNNVGKMRREFDRRKGMRDRQGMTGQYHFVPNRAHGSHK